MIFGWRCHPLDRFRDPPVGEAGSLKAGQTSLEQPVQPGMQASVNCAVKRSSWVCVPHHAGSPGVPAGPRCRRCLRPPRTSPQSGWETQQVGPGEPLSTCGKRGEPFGEGFVNADVSSSELGATGNFGSRTESQSHAGGDWELEEVSEPDSCTRPSCTEQGVSGRQPAARPYKNVPWVPILP